MDILEQLRGQAEQVEVVRVRNEATTVEFEANRFKTSKVEETRGVAARIVRNGRLGFSASSDETAADRLLANVLESAAFGDAVPIVFPAPRAAMPVKTFDPVVAELPVTRLVEMGREIVEAIRSADGAARVGVSLKRSVSHVAIQNQAGTEAAFQRSPLSVSVEVDRVEGDDVLMLGEVVGATAWDEDYLAVARRLAEQLQQARRITTVRAGRMPVVFAPMGALVLCLPLMQGLDGKNVFTGISPMQGKVGEKLFDERVTVVDDGTLDGRFGSAPYDDEGVPHRPNALIERGVLRGFLYDLKTAAQSGVESTGNGSRELFTPPAPSPTNLIFAAGSTPLSEILAGIDEGIMILDVLGLGQGNVISGAFSNPVNVGFKIERGEIVGRVKGIAIAGNVYELLQNVAAVSRETLWVYHSLCMPYVLLPEMTVVAKE